jgi:DNA-binding HxlR family transcriptional regulator
MITRGRTYGCPVELSLTMLGGKWKTVILARLKQQALRYGELRRLIPDLSDKVLTQRLHELEEDGFIVRRHEGGEARYAMTERGVSLQPVLEALFHWGLTEAPMHDARFRAGG